MSIILVQCWPDGGLMNMDVIQCKSGLTVHTPLGFFVTSHNYLPCPWSVCVCVYFCGFFFFWTTFLERVTLVPNFLRLYVICLTMDWWRPNQKVSECFPTWWASIRLFQLSSRISFDLEAWYTFINLSGTLHMNSSCPALLSAIMMSVIEVRETCRTAAMLLIAFSSHSIASWFSITNRLGTFQVQSEASFKFDILFPSNNNRAALTDSVMWGFV